MLKHSQFDRTLQYPDFDLEWLLFFSGRLPEMRRASVGRGVVGGGGGGGGPGSDSGSSGNSTGDSFDSSSSSSRLHQLRLGGAMGQQGGPPPLMVGGAMPHHHAQHPSVAAVQSLRGLPPDMASMQASAANATYQQQ